MAIVVTGRKHDPETCQSYSCQLCIVHRNITHFSNSMDGRYAGNTVMPTTVALFLMLTDTDHYEAAVSWLYEVRTVELMREYEQRRRANA
jgi:hypothetical protein